MRFTVDRTNMLEYMKTMEDIIPRNSAIAALKGFLIEAYEDEGYIIITANNLESAMQRKLAADVETSGAFVMNAKVLIDILTHLAENDISFSMEDNAGIVEISSGNCTYVMNTLNANEFPHTDIPFPDSTMKISGVQQIYKKTCSAVDPENSGVIGGIHFEVTPNYIRAVGCDRKSIAAVRYGVNCSGSLNVVLPKRAMYSLSSVMGNDEVEVGTRGHNVIFMKNDMLFSVRRLDGEYVNTDKILNSISPIYTAKIEYEEFKEPIQRLTKISEIGSESSYVKLEFEENKLTVATQNDIGSGEYSAKAVMIEGTAGHSFYYPAEMLKNILKTMTGTMIIKLDSNGYMLVFNKYDKYFLTSLTDTAVNRQLVKFEERKAKLRNKKDINAVKVA